MLKYQFKGTHIYALFCILQTHYIVCIKIFCYLQTNSVITDLRILIIGGLILI